MTALLKATGISKKYHPASNTPELALCSLTLEKGRTYVIKGRSGSGKTTLLNLLGGMDKPSTGSVYYNGKSFYDLSDREQSAIRNKNFGFVFQSFNLIPELTAYENIELPRFFNRNCIITSSAISTVAEEMKIGSLLHRRTYELSGGEQQRVAIARALITSPDMIFADEPTGNLDSAASRMVADLLVKTVKSRQATLVLVTHEDNLIYSEHIQLNIRDGHVGAMEVCNGSLGI
ncbi:ABC transporter ATP-binding protein [Paenibacillus sambharensis]|uniref:ABC transporter ATP-binding protein n=1 Tax=Paenibacillus sambharensis TaxID=1803190 RepID=A0A2W1LSV5_9BACL|nr:ABC transporter ATP-binding protein [Paenibacillus sambharensis]PZD97574.1 ABC transporter ATP-binding protein [Paenibacillus sambharensis]